MSADFDDFVRQHVSSVGTSVTSEDVDTYEKIALIQARTSRERGAQKLRLMYGGVLLALLVSQVIAVTILAFLIGFDVVTIDRWVATTFVAGTFSEVSGMAFLVVRHLFPVDRAGS